MSSEQERSPFKKIDTAREDAGLDPIAPWSGTIYVGSNGQHLRMHEGDLGQPVFEVVDYKNLKNEPVNQSPPAID